MNGTAGPPNRPVAITLRIYRALANAFPHEFKNVYGDELVQVAEDAAEVIWRRHGIPGLVRLLLDIAVRVPAEHLDEVRRDVRHAFRTLAGSPGFTAVALTSLCLGITIASCAYSEVNGILRDLPGVPRPNELVAVHLPVSYPTYKRYSQLGDLFSSAFAYMAPVPFGVNQGGRTERTWGHLVTPSYFSTLGIQPHMGRFFDRGDETPGQSPAVVVSYRFWQDHLGSDPQIIGKTISLNRHPCTIIGVGPEKFQGVSPALVSADLFLPVTLGPEVAPELDKDALDRRDLKMFQFVGRLRPGVSDSAAQAELNAVAQQLAQFYGDPDRNDPKAERVQFLQGGKVMPLRKQDVPFFKQFLLVLGGLLLLIACANVANMMLARAADRRKEIAVRLALGASRARLIRQLLTESLLLAAAAAPPAFLLCIWIMHMFSKLRMPMPVPIGVDMTPDWRALVFTFAITALTGVAFGLAPALRATRTDLVSDLKEGGDVRLRRYRAFGLRNSLVLCQMAASLMLLLMTGYLGLGIQSTLGVQEGFDPRDVYLIAVDPIRDGRSPTQTADFFDKLRDRVSRLPAVASVCLTDTLPAAIDGNTGAVFYTSPPQPDGSQRGVWARKHIVGRGYFETAGIKILSGRAFDKRDEIDGANGIIVSREAVRRFWNGEDPVGRRVEAGNGDPSGSFGLWPGTLDLRTGMLGKATRTYQVIGVARDVSEEIIASKKLAAVYFPLQPAAYSQPSLRGTTLMIRTRPGMDVITAVRREIAAIDPDISPFNARSMAEHVGQFMSTLKAASWTYGLMGVFGLVLAAVGLAGVTAHSVARRGHEIGIRMALGAQKRDVLRMVMKEGAVLAVLGTVIGLTLALGSIRALSVMFFAVASVQGYDPVLLVGAPVLLSALALAACYVPARRSTRIDPVMTLRME